MNDSSHFFFFFNDTATTEIYTLSLHDALPILPSTAHRMPRRLSKVISRGGWVVTKSVVGILGCIEVVGPCGPAKLAGGRDRKSTRLNSSHANISYAVFCLKKKDCLFSGRQSST